MNWNAIETSLQLAGVTAGILLLLAIPTAYWLAFSRWRWKFLVESLVALPLVLPPTVLGFYLLMLLGPRGPLGKLSQLTVGYPLAFTFEGLVLASILYSLPFAVQPLAVAFGAVDVRLMEASWTLGVSRLETFVRVVLPRSLAGVLTSLVLSFAHTLGEFGVVLMVGGNIEGVTRTVSIDIYDDVQALDYTGAAQTSLLLLVVSFLVLAAVYALNRKVWTLWPALPRG
ncbi:MAG: molybdate ABC transporter permease subunit [Acidobacteria bacterium]|nr:molybdate ABC transporter permease subunit [Acidobacteriota bacterium]